MSVPCRPVGLSLKAVQMQTRLTRQVPAQAIPETLTALVLTMIAHLEDCCQDHSHQRSAHFFQTTPAVRSLQSQLSIAANNGDSAQRAGPIALIFSSVLMQLHF